MSGDLSRLVLAVGFLLYTRRCSTFRTVQIAHLRNILRIIELA